MIKKITILAVIVAAAVCVAQYINHKTEEEETGENPTAEKLMMVNTPDGLQSQVKNYHGYTLSFNKDNGTANWASWELLASETDGPEVRKDHDFWKDEGIEDCPDKDAYKKSGYDRGHLCPAADMKWSFDSMHDCFSMANMTPQDKALNTGAWNTLENKTRLWAQRDSALIVIAGPIYSPSDKKRIAHGKVRVPSAFFKVLLAPYLPQPRAIAFVYPNMRAPGNMQNYAMSVDKLEELTGYDFLAALPDDVENSVESTFSFKDWNKK